MADKNSYLSCVTYKGGKDSYEFPFSYLRKDFVKAQIDVSEHESNTLTYLVDYTIDGHTIELTKPVDADKTITIYRETSSAPLVEYEDSSILRAYDLNLSQRQNLNILEEQTDIVEKNYSLSQDTKDYMYKNLMDTKTAIDNKMSETLDTVNASVSTMNENLNTATSSMDNKISQASQALEDAKANLETTKSDVEKALADTQDSMKATENRVNETKADITKLATEFKESESSLQDAIKNINTTNRNMSYEVGDQIHSSYLPFNCYITCVTAGTTGDTLPVIPEGDHDSGFTYRDGTATFKMDYWPLSINGKKPLNKAGDITLNDAYLPLSGGEVTGAVNFAGGATGNWTGTVRGGNVAFEDKILKHFDSKKDQSLDFIFNCNIYHYPVCLVSVTTMFYRNTGSSQRVINFGVAALYPGGWDINWLYSKENHNYIDYVGNTYAITVKNNAPLTINVSWKAQSQDTATVFADTSVWVKSIGE